MCLFSFAGVEWTTKVSGCQIHIGVNLQVDAILFVLCTSNGK